MRMVVRRRNGNYFWHRRSWDNRSRISLMCWILCWRWVAQITWSRLNDLWHSEIWRISDYLYSLQIKSGNNNNFLWKNQFAKFTSNFKYRRHHRYWLRECSTVGSVITIKLFRGVIIDWMAHLGCVDVWILTMGLSKFQFWILIFKDVGDTVFRIISWYQRGCALDYPFFK